MSKNVLVVGATSAIAQATSRFFAADNASFFLVGRNADKLDAVARDLLTRGAEKVETSTIDLADFATHAGILDGALATLGSLDVVLVAHGSMGDQKRCEASFAEAQREISVNFLSYVSILTPIANHLEAAGKGSIAAISSPAGDRGRRSNYIYGAAKGGLSIYIEGLWHRLITSRVNVLLVKPGFVDTPMTKDMVKGRLFVKPEVIGAGIYRAIQKGRATVYLPWFWWVIMTAVRWVPAPIFKRVNL